MNPLIRIENDWLLYEAYTMTGELYDAFELHKERVGTIRLLMPFLKHWSIKFLLIDPKYCEKLEKNPVAPLCKT